ncbi:unnamed protein product, partial [Closterium sp. NIES-64]
AIADTPSFVFLWVGDAEGLEYGRMCLKKWGFRRCEDICWEKTNGVYLLPLPVLHPLIILLSSSLILLRTSPLTPSGAFAAVRTSAG